MFTTLLESRPAKRRLARTVWVSAIVHIAVIGWAVTLTPVRGLTRSIDLPGHVIFVDPALRVSEAARPPAGSESETRKAARRLPEKSGAVPKADMTDVSASDRGRGVTSDATEASSSPHDDDLSGLAYAERPAMPLSDNPRPVYPDSLRTKNVEGAVIARFVVDTTGRVEPGSVAILAADHELFAAAVSSALAADRFLPAETGGRKVRMLVEQPFEFAIERQ
jgi:protein TonB